MRHFLFRTVTLTALSALLGLGACANTSTGSGSGSGTGDKNAADPRLQQNLRVDVLDASGKPINGLACRLSNEHGYFLAQSGGSVLVKRSARDLAVDCDAPPGLRTQAQLRPRPESGAAPSATDAKGKGGSGSGNNTSVYGSVGVGSFGSRGGVGINIGFPIPIGTASDPAPAAAATNTPWRYPEWVQLRQGKTLLFDAQGSSSAQPALAYEAVRP
jgi:hypothetical protein